MRIFDGRTPVMLRARERYLSGELRAGMLVLLAGLFLAACGLLCASQPSYAASGQIYSATIQRNYKHPVTGVIEDAGGQNGYATGQGMVEGCISSKGMLEQTSDGAYYLTIRLSLIDYTSKRQFKVQKWGASGWSSTTFGVTKKGKDTDGATYDYCIQIPSKNAIVRMSMYVKPMGRSVICYFYAKDLAKGKPSGMNATIVTQTGSVKSGSAANATTSSSNSTKAQSTTETKQKTTAKKSTSSSGTSSNSGTESSSSDDAAGDSSSSSSDDLTGAGVNSAQGLDLSTQSSSSSDDANEDNNNTGSMTSEQLFATVMGAVVAGGVVVIVIAAFVVYYFRRHWAQWNSTDPDNYEKAYRESVTAAQGESTMSSAERAAQVVSANGSTQHLDADGSDGASDGKGA